MKWDTIGKLGETDRGKLLIDRCRKPFSKGQDGEL